jgi:hypothetical protein
VQQEHGGHLAHPRSIGPEFGPFDIEEQPAAANLDPHIELPPERGGLVREPFVTRHTGADCIAL